MLNIKYTLKVRICKVYLYKFLVLKISELSTLLSYMEMLLSFHEHVFVLGKISVSTGTSLADQYYYHFSSISDCLTG